MTSFDSDRFRDLLERHRDLRSVGEIVATYTVQRVLPDDRGEESVVIEILDLGGVYMANVHNADNPERHCSSGNPSSNLQFVLANIHWEKMDGTPLPGHTT